MVRLSAFVFKPRGQGMMVRQEPDRRGEVLFFPITSFEHSFATSSGVKPLHRDFLCGACGSSTSGRVLCHMVRQDRSLVEWCVCSCERREPTLVVSEDGKMQLQLPIAR